MASQSIPCRTSSPISRRSTRSRAASTFLTAAANITANLDQLNDDLHIDAIAISDNGNVGASIQQLTTDKTAIGKLQNANLSPVLLAITDTTADIQAGLSTLVQDAGEIASITASDGPIVVSAATFLADQSALDKIVGGFDVSDTAANVMADLDQLDDPNISAITISDNGQISASVAQLTADATAIGKLQNENGSPALLAINDTAGAVQTGLSTLVADTGEIGSITASHEPIVVSAATFQADQSTLDKIAGGFDVSDDAANLAAALSALNADSGVDAITADSGDATLSGGAGVNVPNFSESGWATSLTVSEAVDYAGAFSQGSGSTLSISSADTLSLTGTASLSGTTSGAGTLALWGGSATIDTGATISVSNWSISGAGTDVTLDESLGYAGSFSEGAGDTFVLSGGHLLLTGAATFAGGTVDGSKLLETEGTTTVSGLTIGGTVQWENTAAVTQSGGTVTIGDASGDKAFLNNTSTGTYDIADDSGIDRGSSTASDILNAGLIEKTGGTGVSTIVPNVTNNGTIEVTSGTLDFKGRISGTGSDTISGASTLEFDAKVAAGQTVDFTGSGGELALHAPAAFAGSISGFDTAGAGSSDTISVAGPWAFTGFTENAGGTEGTLGFMSGATTLGLTLVGDYNPADFVRQTRANGSTLITYTGVSWLDSLLRPVSGAETHAGEFGVREATTGARAATGASALAGTARSVTHLGLRRCPGRGPRWRSQAKPVRNHVSPPDATAEPRRQHARRRLVRWRRGADRRSRQRRDSARQDRLPGAKRGGSGDGARIHHGVVGRPWADGGEAPGRAGPRGCGARSERRAPRGRLEGGVKGQGRRFRRALDHRRGEERRRTGEQARPFRRRDPLESFDLLGKSLEALEKALDFPLN